MRPPADLTPKGRGRRFWREVTDAYTLSTDEIPVLTEICRTLDTLDALQAVALEDGPTSLGSTGQVVVHPALVELRQQRSELRRLLAQLELPDPEQAGKPAMRSARSNRAARAAAVRWSLHG